jgi:putative membrane protein
MILIRWSISTIAILLAAYVVPGVMVAGFWSAVWLALFLGIINVSLKPLLIILTLPVNILTLGLFTFVINALMILLATTIITGFSVSGFWAAMLFGIVLSIINFLLNRIFQTKKI